MPPVAEPVKDTLSGPLRKFVEATPGSQVDGKGKNAGTVASLDRSTHDLVELCVEFYRL
ncbi:MAG: hypothetical protein QOE61_550 [Micromonosporaceae bacterium]|nr:hypothetical protein [Micromonosporaceae bacterium]